ncbi:hypothetical protein [Brevibacillus invocatus]|uniref:restriction endonuclease-related protein n=1 Tax=Brevibacillus invocatus TaxID=173959 RepID=UPI00203F1B16|nr:hypothetical protein [Brevibacillus invocatus]MCM3081751.1 hypothetical protein [Brevibacillus invocatus]MCM3432158.1 hypothetical protein [Brevibacillus invocatus]
MSKIQDMLFYLITGLQKWREDYSQIPEDLHKGMLMFIHEAAHSGSDFPADLHHLLQILHKPSKEWGIQGLAEFYPAEAALIEEFIGITPDAEDFLNIYISPKEAQQKNMLAILKFCRDDGLNLQDEYARVRKFLSQSQNAVLSSFQLAQFAESFRDRELSNLVRHCYIEITPLISNYRKCPHCGWTLEYKQDQWHCNKENICREMSNFEKFEHFNFGDERVYRMLPGIQRYVLLPGISEMKIADNLMRKGYQVELYPNVDEYDLAVSLLGKQVFLDVKDFKDPSMLANFFNQKTLSYLEKYSEHVYVVIPSYRNDLYSSYSKRVSMLLKDDAKKYIKIIMENELEQMLKWVL